MWPVIGITPGQACGDRAITYRIGAQRGNWRLYIRRSLGCQGEIRWDFPKTLKGVLRVSCELRPFGGCLGTGFRRWISSLPLSEALSRFSAMTIYQKHPSLKSCSIFVWRII